MENKQIEPEDLIYLEEDLSKEELFSVLFLLYGKEDPKWILEKLTCKSKNLLYDFATHHTNWKTAIVQALTIVQIFEVIENLGVEISEAREDLSRKCEINAGLRVLFQLCDACTKKPTSGLILHIKNKCESAKNSNAEMLEVYMLHLIASRTIKVSSSLDDCDFSFITNFFNENKFNEVDRVLLKFPKKTNSLDNSNNNAFNQINLLAQPPSNAKALSTVGEYKARVLHVLVINQQTFYRETNPEITQLLPDHELNERRGTAQDTKALQLLFESFGYQVSTKNNLTHLEILKAVDKATKKASLVDGLVVCILSHGHEGIIYGHNSIPVPIKKIKQIMASKILLGKPKIFLIQACQGESLQRSVRSVTTRHEADGPSQSFTSGSVLADFLTFWSTIEGFASVRHIDHGSWFIQELVKKIRELHKEQHLMDICTAVIDEVSKKRGYQDECMLSKLESTFTKKFRFPEVKNDSKC